MKVLRSDNNMITEAYLVNTQPQEIKVVYNANEYVIPMNEIVLTDGGVAQIMLDQTLRYDSLVNGVYENPRYLLKAFPTLKEAQDYLASLSNSIVAEEKVKLPTEESPIKKRSITNFTKSELIAVAKERYGASFSEESTRDEILQFIRSKA